MSASIGLNDSASRPMESPDVKYSSSTGEATSGYDVSRWTCSAIAAAIPADDDHAERPPRRGDHLKSFFEKISTAAATRASE